MILLALTLQTIGGTKYVYSQVHMGVNFTLTLYARDEKVAQSAAVKAFARIQKLDEIMSDYQARSELNQLNQSAFQHDTRISQDLYRVVDKSLALSRETNGLFDITIKPLVQIWRNTRKTGLQAPPSEIEKARERVGFRYVRLVSKTRSIRFLKDGITLDLGGIGKGYACQEAIKEVSASGISSAMIEGGGDLYCSKAPPSTKGWVISIEGTSDKVTLIDRAMSTSGSTVQFVEVGGKKYSHIIDPRTAMGLTTRRQVTVIGKDGAKVDALATVFCIEPKLVSRFRDVKAMVNSRD